MSTNQDIKKPQRKADETLPERKNRHGKQPHQKLKPYIVLQYLQKYTDENNVASAFDLIAYLEEYGINSDRRSIYKDIEEINIISYMLENETDIETAAEVIKKDEDGIDKVVVYDRKKKGFYVQQRHYDLNDIRLLAECVYSAKFIAESKAKTLVDVVCEFVSEKQAEKIQHNAFLVDRVKTNNKSVLNNISTINDAMGRELDGEKHTPEKISFKYLHYTINSLDEQVERKPGQRTVVSPYALLINDGNYYLLAYNEKAKDLRTYRVDRMKDVRTTGEEREGQEAFDAIDLKSYTRRVFNMYGGNLRRVTVRFRNFLLDTMVERFGTTGVSYSKEDDEHYTVTAEVEISNQFYGWLLGFGKRVKLTYPDDIIADFSKYIDNIRTMY